MYLFYEDQIDDVESILYSIHIEPSSLQKSEFVSMYKEPFHKLCK